MTITIKPKIVPQEVNIEMEYGCAELLMRIRINMGVLDAIRTLRYIFPKIGLIEAKNFIETLDV